MDLEKEHQLFSKKLLCYTPAETTGSFGIWHLNPDTLEVYYSDNVYHIFGMRPQRLPARLNIFEERIYPEDRQTVADAFRQTFFGRLPLHLEFRVAWPDGMSRWVDLTSCWNFDT